MRVLMMVGVVLFCSSQAAPVKAGPAFRMGYVLASANAGVVGWVPVALSNGTYKTKTGSFIPKGSLKALVESDETPVTLDGVMVHPPPMTYRSSEGWQKLAWGSTTAEVESFSGAKALPSTREGITRLEWKTRIAEAQASVLAVLINGRLARIDLFPTDGTPEFWYDLLATKYGVGVLSSDDQSRTWSTTDTIINARTPVPWRWTWAERVEPVTLRISYYSTLFGRFLDPALELEKRRLASEL